MTKIVRFQPTDALSPTSDNSSSISATSLPMPLQQRIRAMIDRFQVLALEKPHIASFLLDWVDRFLTRHGVALAAIVGAAGM